MPPLVSCIMPTHDRRPFVGRAIAQFLAQDYANLELIVVDDGSDSIADLLPRDARIRLLRPERRLSVGAKRNLACETAAGDLLMHWDDDDWMAPWRVSYQVRELEEKRAEVCGLARLYFYDEESHRAWEYVYPDARRGWLAGGTLCYRKDVWRAHPFPDVNEGEDTRFIWNLHGVSLLALEDPAFYVASIHRGNTSRKRLEERRYRPCATEVVEDIMQRAAKASSALVVAAGGVGDLVRITPLVTVCRTLGFEVDMLVAPDYADADALLRGTREVRRFFQDRSPWTGAGRVDVAGLAANTYDVAIVSALGASCRHPVRARRRLEFERARWLRDGDRACVAAIARELGWQGPLPPPFVVPSGRSFDLAFGTVALHPGCKANWPWKKWHGFDLLAERLPHVVLIGTPSDLDNQQTYFSKAFNWPVHVRSFIGELDLADTAALLSECTALVSNDSGLMHVAAALGIPTFGIFGITSPAREALDVPNMLPITKGLPCEPACRQGAWGRRDCEFHLDCLRALTPDDVLAHVVRVLPGVLDPPAGADAFATH